MSKRDQELRRHFHKNIKSLGILLCKTLSFCQFLSRPTIPSHKVETASPIQTSNLIRLKEFKFGSNRNNFRETKYVCLYITKQAAYILSVTFWIHFHPKKNDIVIMRNTI